MSDKKVDIAQWWAANPMSYGEEHGTTTYRGSSGKKDIQFGSLEFFEAADRQFYEWNRPLIENGKPFAKIFPFERYQGKKVLEIGCGMGAMSSLWAKAGAQMTSVDLNPVAIEQTKNRFKLLGLQGQIQQEDANRLSFADETFDYGYSWGVLHHSPNLELSIREFFRVLKPGAEFGIMLYNRNSILHAYHTLYCEGFLHDEKRFLNPVELASRYGDGGRQEGNPHTWPVTEEEMRAMFAPHVANVDFKRLGTDLDSTFKYLLPGLYFLIPKWAMKPWARRWGWSLWMSGKKRV